MISESMLAEMASVDDSLPGTIPSEEHQCAGAKYHSPTPLAVHKFPMGDTQVYLCATCADNFDVFTTLLYKYEGQMPWDLRKQFGNRIRAVAESAWAMKEEVARGTE